LNDLKDKVEDQNKQIQDLLNQINNNNNANSNNNNKDQDSDKKSETKSRKDSTNSKASKSGENNSDLKNEVDNLKNDMEDMKKKFEEQIAELHKLLEDYVKKDEFNAYKDQTNNKLQSHQDSIDDLYNLVKDLNSKLGEKLNCENFDEHLNDYNNIKNLVLALANNQKGEGDAQPLVQQIVQQTGSGLSSKDSNLLKELGQKFPALEDLVKKLQKDLNDHLLNFKSFSDDTQRKIQNGEENVKSLKSDVQNFKSDTNNFKNETNKKMTDVEKRIAELEAAIKTLRDQLVSLSSISSTGGSSGGGESSADIQKLQIAINSLNQRINNMESELSELNKLKERVNNVQDTCNDNRNRIINIEEELADLRGLKARIEQIELIIKDLKDRSKGSRRTSFDHENASHSGVTLEQVKEIVDEEIRKLRDELMSLIEALKDALDKKADTEDLYKSEAALLEKLDQIAGALMKRAQADKNDTKKALMFLEKKIKEITVLLFGGPDKGEEGAIFAKKPWTPWSCASCDSKLKDYPGALIDHKNWNKLPQRETSPGRLTQGKFGKGWSRWADNKRNTTEKFGVGINKNGDTLPEIHQPGTRAQMDSSRGNE